MLASGVLAGTAAMRVTVARASLAVQMPTGRGTNSHGRVAASVRMSCTRGLDAARFEPIGLNFTESIAVRKRDDRPCRSAQRTAPLPQCVYMICN
jgi:hypothetical protein